MKANPVPFIRLSTNPPPAIPPKGFVDLRVDAETGRLIMMDDDGTKTDLTTTEDP